MRPTRKRPTHRRGGYVLVLFVMLLFGIFAMAALVIDIGFARLAQRQMQTAADSAALEGLRYVDRDGRQRAGDMAAWTFDDDLELNGNPTNLGAGPVINFSNPVDDSGLYASEFMSIPSTPFYRPSGSNALAQNPGNNITGDMLEGKFAFAPRDGSTAEEIRAFHQEADDYSRSDFPNPDPDGSIGLERHRAFLVRVRRTGETFPVEEVGTSGPTLPYLFARGALMFDRDAPDNPRRLIGDGIRVRATAIAGARPVVCIGTANPNLTRPLLGGLNVAVDFAIWEPLPENAMVSSGDYIFSSVRVVGEEISTGEPITGTGYVALYETFDSVNRVIGFAYASYDATTGQVEKMSFTDGTFDIASENASAVFCNPQTAPNDVLATIIARQSDPVVKDQILHAPALVR